MGSACEQTLPGGLKFKPARTRVPGAAAPSRSTAPLFVTLSRSPSPPRLRPIKSISLFPLSQKRPRKETRRGQGKRGVAAGRAQQVAYIPSASRASCPAEVTILRAAGRAAGAPASCPPCGARVAERRRGAGEKGAGEAGPAPDAGGWSEDRAPLGWHAPPALPAGGNRKEVPSPLRHSATGARQATLPPRRGCPTKGARGGDRRLGAGTLHAPSRARAAGRGGATWESLSRAARASHPGPGEGRKRLTSDTAPSCPRPAPAGPCGTGRSPTVPGRSGGF